MDFGSNALGLASLGLGAAGDIFGAYSQAKQREQQQKVYQNFLTQQQRLNDPQYMIGQATPLYNANIEALQRSLPAYMRSTINPMLGGKGIDPMGGLGQSLIEQSIAPQYQNAWQNATQQAYGAQSQGLGALAGAGGMVPQHLGQLGGTANALQSMALLQAMQRGGGQQPQQGGQQPGIADIGGLSGGSSYMGDPSQYNVGSMGGMNLTGGNFQPSQF